MLSTIKLDAGKERVMLIFNLLRHKHVTFCALGLHQSQEIFAKK